MSFLPKQKQNGKNLCRPAVLPGSAYRLYKCPRKRRKRLCIVCASSDEEKVLYFAREKKGHEGVKGTVTEDFRGILVHDHEITFYRYGSAHQECLAHVERYLKDSMENESSLTWNRRMRELLQRMIHYRKEHTGEASLDAQTVAALRQSIRKSWTKPKKNTNVMSQARITAKLQLISPDAGI